MLGEFFGLGPIEIVMVQALGICLFGKGLPRIGRYLGRLIGMSKISRLRRDLQRYLESSQNG